MQEFCPKCAKNGQENKIRAYQLNFEEAVFMCSYPKCTWPAGHQELTIISRQIGKEHSSDWEKIASKYIKTEQDRLLEFQPYTPPQTPTALCDIMSIPIDDIMFLPDKEQLPSNFQNKPSDSIANSTISNEKKRSKPKVVSVKIISNKITPANSKPMLIKTKKISLGPPVMKQIKVTTENSLKGCKTIKSEKHPYKKFNLCDLSQNKVKSVNNACESNVFKVEGVEVKTEDCLNEFNTIKDNVSNNLDSIIVDPLKNIKNDLDTVLAESSNSKYSEIKLLDNSMDIDLDEILGTLSDDTINFELDHLDDFNWMNNLH